MGCGNLSSKGSEEVSTNCWLEPVQGVLLELLPQREPSTEEVNPSHGCESCQVIAQLLQHPEICVYDLLDGIDVVECWDMVRSPSNK